MAKKVLSIEIGQQVTKAVVTDYLKKNPHVYDAFSFDTPPDAIEDGYVRQREAVANLLSKQIKENGVKEKDVVFSIASSKIASREVVVPFVPENKLKELVNATAQEYFPVNMDEYTLAYNVLDVVKENDKKSLKLLLLAAPDTLIQNYYGLADDIGVHIEALDYYGNGSMQVLQKHIGSGYNVCVQIGSLNTMVSVMREGQQIMQRTIPYGTNTILDTMIEQQALQVRDRNEAMDLLCRDNIIYTSLDYDDIESVRSTRMTEDQYSRSNYDPGARRVVTDAVGSILLSVIRVVDYFGSKYPDSRLMSVYITGMGVKIRGIDALFEKEMDLPVRRLEKLTNITFSRGFARSLQDQTEYIAAIGAAIEPVGFRLKSLSDKQSNAQGMLAARIIFGVCLAVAIGLVGVSWYRMHTQEVLKGRLEDEIRKLEPIREVYAKNEKATTSYEQAKALHGYTKTNNVALVPLMQLLQNKMPKNMMITSMQSDGLQVTMAIKTKTKISAAKLIAELEHVDEQSKYLTNIQVQAISGDKAEGYNFSASADFTALALESDEAEEGLDIDADMDTTAEGTAE